MSHGYNKLLALQISHIYFKYNILLSVLSNDALRLCFLCPQYTNFTLHKAENTFSCIIFMHCICCVFYRTPTKHTNKRHNNAEIKRKLSENIQWDGCSNTRLISSGVEQQSCKLEVVSSNLTWGWSLSKLFQAFQWIRIVWNGTSKLVKDEAFASRYFQSDLGVLNILLSVLIEWFCHRNSVLDLISPQY